MIEIEETIVIIIKINIPETIGTIGTIEILEIIKNIIKKDLYS